MCKCAGCFAAPSGRGAGPLQVAGGGSEVRLRAAWERARVPGDRLQAAFWAQRAPARPGRALGAALRAALAKFALNSLPAA